MVDFDDLRRYLFKGYICKKSEINHEIVEIDICIYLKDIFVRKGRVILALYGGHDNNRN